MNLTAFFFNLIIFFNVCDDGIYCVYNDVRLFIAKLNKFYLIIKCAET